MCVTQASRRASGRRAFQPARAETVSSSSSDLHGFATTDGMLELQPLHQSGFAKPDTELRGCVGGRAGRAPPGARAPRQVSAWTPFDPASTSRPPLPRLRSLLNRIYKASDASPQRSQRARVTTPVRGVPVYVMLPLDTVWLVERDGNAKPMLIREKAMEVGLEMLNAAGVEGVMIDIWWGIVEHGGPGRYDFSAYRRLFEQVAAKGLKIQAVMSFHAAGGNVGDTCKIPLPKWVLAAGDADPDIFYTDRSGYRNRECLSLGCCQAPVLGGRSPLQAYKDFMAAFADEFSPMFGELARGALALLGVGRPWEDIFLLGLPSTAGC